MTSTATARLMAERKNWRKDHPPGFYAKPMQNADGSANMLVWECGIPGKAGSDWEGGLYKLMLKFSTDYPQLPPDAYFTPPIFHPNIFDNGKVCLSILKQEGGWRPSIRIKDILMGIQTLLTDPNNNDPAQGAAFRLYGSNKVAYAKRIRQQAAEFAAAD